MKRVLYSGVCVSANMVASLFIVALITREIEADERGLFFLFQAVFFPLSTLLSQTNIYLHYRNVDVSGLRWVFLLASVVLSYVLLLTSAKELGDELTYISYALSVPLSFMAASGLARQQHVQGSNFKISAVNIVVALARVIAAYTCIQYFGASTTFLVCSLVFFSAVKGFEFLLEGRKLPEQSQGRASAAWAEALYMMVFFIATAVAFQWDKFLFTMHGSLDLVVSAGVYSAFMLSPVSIIYATLTRADSSAIFNREKGDPGVGLYRKLALRFTGCAALYLVLIFVFWENVTRFMFPFFHENAAEAIVLGAAVIFDRLGNLRVVLHNKVKMYMTHGGIKLGLSAVAFLVLYHSKNSVSIIDVYMTLFLVSALVLVMGSLMCKRTAA